MTNQEQPSGEIVLRTLAMPKDANPDGDIFGGWVLSQMDIAGGIFIKNLISGRCVTVAVDSMTFHLPVFIGDVVCCYAKVQKVGKTSVKVKIETWITRQYSGELIKVTEGTFVYVALDEDRKPKRIDSILKIK